MVLTSHFVDSDWYLQKGILNFVDVPPPHSGVVVYDALYKCLQDWDVIENERESVKHIATSTARLTIFSDIVKQLQLPNKRLILDCCTRWNATYSMLPCAMEFKDVFSQHAQRDVSYKYLPSDEDWMRVEEVCSFLALFNEVTNIILDSEYPTSNLFLTELWSIKELLMEKSLSNELWMRQMAGKIQIKFDKYWGEYNLLISIAAILDPKMKLIDFSFCVIYSKDEAHRQIHIMRDSLYELYKEYVVEYAATNVGTSVENDVQESGVSNVSNTSKTGKGKIMTGRSKFERYIRSVKTVDDVKSELDTYLEGVFICKENFGDFDALEWWKVIKFQILSKMAIEILSIPITTIAS
ncbi:zinc finger BED domain-containing protein RICESLEEPER 2-like [Hibiscus syriacus]|uniref:zinc finger BED domain-containing protein RICESLEEPER 2-like n=1 Tax=Hibiscus syriacus TaxID=106335 RepID=UPI001920F65C|nr:zinc finger BED domain-containing protein RICESLEEPER 2-like [Hibiscus syriacus]